MLLRRRHTRMTMTRILTMRRMLVISSMIVRGLVGRKDNMVLLLLTDQGTELMHRLQRPLGESPGRQVG